MKSATAPRAMLLALALLAGVPVQAQKQPATGTAASVEGGGLPDLARGKRAAAAGHDAEAESNFLPLAQRGYTEAQVALARLYAHQQSTQKAIHWFRVAAATGTAAGRGSAGAPAVAAGQPDAAGRGATAVHACVGRTPGSGGAGRPDRAVRLEPELRQRETHAMLVASAEKLDLPVTTGALISWYRHTRDMPGHNERLLRCVASR